MKYVKPIIFGVVVFALGWLLGTSFGPEALGKSLGEALSDSKTIAAVMSAIFALCTLLVQYAIGSKQAIIGTRQAEASRISSEAAMQMAENAGNRAIAVLRMNWIEVLRKTISEYHSILMTSDDKINETDHRRLSDLGTNLDLMLNLDENNQKQLWDALDKIYGTENHKMRQEMDAELMVAGRIVLKTEWEKVKKELRGEGPQI